MKKKILIFSTAYEPFVGGAEVAVREITNGLGDFEFHMLTAKMDRKLSSVEKIGNIHVHRVGVGVPLLDKLLLASLGHRYAMKMHKKYSYDAAWSIMASYGGFACQKFSKKTGVPYLLTLQEGDPIEFIMKRVRFVKGWFKKIFTQAVGLQAISTYLMTWGESMGFDGKVKEVVPNGVDVTQFTQSHGEKAVTVLRKRFGEDKFILVTVSRLVKKNGVEHVIRALPKLPNVVFVVCGDGGLRDSLKSLAIQLGVDDRVLFQGTVSHKALPLILHASDAFIRPSLSEGLGNAFLESMAAGLPTIGTMVGGIPDFLEDKKTGVACKPSDPESIVKAVMFVQEMSAQELKLMHAEAMNVIKEKFHWEYIQGRMKHLFDQIKMNKE